MIRPSGSALAIAQQKDTGTDERLRGTGSVYSGVDRPNMIHTFHSMSRGFVKEDDQEEAPFIPPRAALPDGVANHVTPRGLGQLLHERKTLEVERAGTQGSEDDRRRAHAVIDGRMDLLNERIVTAHVVGPGPGPHLEVRFGNTVTFRYLNGPQQGTERTFTIVGVDEASLAEQRIAFVAPVARALMGKRVGQVAEFTLGAQQQRLEVLAING